MFYVYLIKSIPYPEQKYIRLYEASCGGPHKARSIGEVVSPEVLTKGGL